YGLSVSAVEQGLAIGVLVSLLFSVVPLLEVRMVKPSLLLRNDVPRLRRIDWGKWGVTAGGGGALRAHRLGEVERDGGGGGGARRGGGVAGRVAARRPDAVGRLRRHGAAAAR